MREDPEASAADDATPSVDAGAELPETGDSED